MQKTILVIGGTGLLGRPVARRLQDGGFGVRVLTRSRARAEATLGAAFEIVEGSALDAACLQEAMSGCQGVHISLQPDIEQAAAALVARLAGAQGIERITYISGGTVAEENAWSPMTRIKLQAEADVRGSGVPFTIFCPTFFMETLPLFVRAGRATVMGKQPPFHWLAAGDYARMVAASYTLDAAANQRFIVHGPEAIPMADALARYCAAFHPEIKQVSTMPIWMVKALATLTRNAGLREAGEMFAYFEKVGEGRGRPPANPILPIPTTTLDRWLEERRAQAAGRPA